MSTQALSAPISSLSLLLVQTQAARWKAATPEQLTGAHLYLDISVRPLALSRVENYATAWMDSWWVRQQILFDFRNRFLTKNMWVHKMTNIIHSYRFVKPYIIHNIAWCIKILDTSWQDCWGMYDKDNMLVCPNVCLFVSIVFLLCSPDAQIW